MSLVRCVGIAVFASACALPAHSRIRGDAVSANKFMHLAGNFAIVMVAREATDSTSAAVAAAVAVSALPERWKYVRRSEGMDCEYSSMLWDAGGIWLAVKWPQWAVEVALNKISVTYKLGF